MFCFLHGGDEKVIVAAYCCSLLLFCRQKAEVWRWRAADAAYEMSIMDWVVGSDWNFSHEVSRESAHLRTLCIVPGLFFLCILSILFFFFLRSSGKILGWLSLSLSLSLCQWVSATLLSIGWLLLVWIVYA